MVLIAPPTDDLRDFGNVSVLHNVMTSREELKKAEEVCGYRIISFSPTISGTARLNIEPLPPRQVLNRSLAKTKEGERRRKVDLTRQKTQLQEDLKQVQKRL